MRAIKIFLPVAILTASCGDHAPSRRDAIATLADKREVAPMETPVPVRFVSTASVPRSSYWAAQKLIRTAEMRIQVRDVPMALRITDSIARSQEALLAESRTSQDADGKRSAEVNLRVPSQHFAAVLRALESLGTVKSQSMGAQDVTKEYADLATRLVVKEQTVARLRGLLENRTAKLAEVLEVERELDRAVAELEQMKGERQYYDQQIAMSTVHVSLFERVPSQVAQVSNPITEALRSSMQVLGTSVGTIIYLLVAVVPWVLFTLGIVWLVKPLRRRLMPGA